MTQSWKNSENPNPQCCAGHGLPWTCCFTLLTSSLLALPMCLSFTDLILLGLVSLDNMLLLSPSYHPCNLFPRVELDLHSSHGVYQCLFTAESKVNFRSFLIPLRLSHPSELSTVVNTKSHLSLALVHGEWGGLNKGFLTPIIYKLSVCVHDSHYYSLSHQFM